MMAYEKAVPLAYEAVSIATSLHIKHYLADAHHNLSDVLLENKKVDFAIINAKAAMQNAKESDYDVMYITAAVSLSAAYDKSGRQSEHLELLKNVLEKK